MIIGLLGRSRVGKDTTAKCIIAALGEDRSALSRLSQPLKDAAQAIYGFTPEQVEDELKEVVDTRYNVTPRVCIQNLCNHIMNLHGRDFFSRRLFLRYDNGQFNQKVLIIPDIRYEHDIHEIQRRGGVVIKVVRDHALIPKHEWEENIESMTGDFTIINDKDLQWINTQVSQILRNMKLS